MLLRTRADSLPITTEPAASLPDAGGSPGSPLQVHHVGWFAVTIAMLVGASFQLRGVMRSVAELFAGDLPANPLFVPEHAFLLYAALPFAVLCTNGMLLAPGFLLSMVIGGAPRVGSLAAMTFGGTLLVRATTHVIGVVAGDVSLGVVGRLAIEVCLDAALLGLLALRVTSGKSTTVPSGVADRRRIGWMIALMATLLVLLLPTIFWQDLSGDGVEALYAGQSLATHIVPRFVGPESGLMGLGNGMIPPTYLVSWFVDLIGPVEAAARLPFVIIMPILFVVLTGLVEHQGSVRLTFADEAGLVAGLAVYVLALAFSASYTTYSADLAAPAVTDTVAILCVAAALLFAWEGHLAWMLVFGLLAHLTRPTGALLLVLLAVGVFALPEAARRTQFARLAAAIVLCVLVSVLYDNVLLPLAAGGLGTSASSSSILGRIRYLVFTDVERTLFAAVPGGVLPFLALFAWRRQDPFARQITVATLLYFVFFYCQAFIALHHFVPVMILPIVVFWRLALAGRWRWRAPAALLAASVSLMVSLPRSAALGRSTRAIGRTMSLRVGNIAGDRRAQRAAIAGASSLFPLEWEVQDPAVERVGEPAALIYYAQSGRTPDDSVNYVIQPLGTLAPSGFRAVATRDKTVAFVRDTARWQRQRLSPPRPDFRARIYDIPRASMHSSLGVPSHAYQIDLAQVPGLWRLF
jgi:hypothetical protein